MPVDNPLWKVCWTGWILFESLCSRFCRQRLFVMALFVAYPSTKRPPTNPKGHQCCGVRHPHYSHSMVPGGLVVIS